MTEPPGPPAPPSLDGQRPGRRRGPSDEELVALLRYFARLLLEVERGFRPPAVLRRFLAPHLAFDIEHAARPRPTGAPAVAVGDIGGVRFQRAGRRQAFGVVVIKEADASWRAMMLRLRRDDAGAWRIVEILRPQPRSLVTLQAPHGDRKEVEGAHR